MKKLLMLFVSLLLVVTVGCSTASVEPDYTTDEFKSALNAGENIVGKTIPIKVDELVSELVEV